MKTIERNITGALLFSNDGYVLLGKNRSGGVYDGYWTIPGGGVDPGETIIEATIREIKEEVGLDISEKDMQLVSKDKTGSSTKTNPTTGEVSTVNMKFTDFQVYFDQPARTITIQPGDDFAIARWIDLDELPDLLLAPGVKASLKELGYL